MTVALLTKEDLPGVVALEAACFAAPWSESSLSLLLGNTAFGVVCREGEQVLAYGGMLHVLDEGQITNIATDAAYRRRGLGHAVLTALLEEARRRGLVTVSLEVREGNLPAIALYEKHGFFVAGKRKNFYENPREHALVMVWQCPKDAE